MPDMAFENSRFIGVGFGRYRCRTQLAVAMRASLWWPATPGLVSGRRRPSRGLGRRWPRPLGGAWLETCFNLFSERTAW